MIKCPIGGCKATVNIAAVETDTDMQVSLHVTFTHRMMTPISICRCFEGRTRAC